MSLVVIGVEAMPEVRRGDDLGRMIAERSHLLDGDVVVVTQKVVSKAEGRLVPLGPGGAHKAKLELVESQSKRVLRRRGELVIAETEHGFVCANAGVDLSNVEEGMALLLPVDPDRSARRIRDHLRSSAGAEVAVVVSDTFGRAWRRGVTDVAIGCAGIAAIADLRGTPDHGGRALQATEICIVDEIASAADLVMGKAAGIPAAIVRGIDPALLRHPSVPREPSVSKEVVRRYEEDLFR
ncbi:MAG: coenzyme F420-0:L-glutamate ligase [Acidimicrobiales bacterium]